MPRSNRQAQVPSVHSSQRIHARLRPRVDRETRSHAWGALCTPAKMTDWSMFPLALLRWRHFVGSMRPTRANLTHLIPLRGVTGRARGRSRGTARRRAHTPCPATLGDACFPREPARALSPHPDRACDPTHALSAKAAAWSPNYPTGAPCPRHISLAFASHADFGRASCPPRPPPALRLATRPTQTYQMPRITPSRRFRSGGRLHRARRPPEGAPSREGRIRARTVGRAPAPAAPAAALAPVALVAAPDVVQPPLGSRHGAMSPLGAGGEARRAKVVTRARLVCSSQYKYCRGFLGAPWPPRGLPRAPLARARTPSPRRALFSVRLRGGCGRGTRGEAAAKYLARKANAGNMGAARSLRVRRVARCLGCEVRLAAVGCGRVGVPWAGLGVTRGTGLGAGGRRGGAKGKESAASRVPLLGGASGVPTAGTRQSGLTRPWLRIPVT